MTTPTPQGDDFVCRAHECKRVRIEQAAALAASEARVAEVTREDWLENFTQFGADLIGQKVRLVVVPCTGGGE